MLGARQRKDEDIVHFLETLTVKWGEGAKSRYDGGQRQNCAESSAPLASQRAEEALRGMTAS